MTYDAREVSADLGSPVELYEFVRGARRIRITSADRDIVFGANTFARAPVARTAIESSIESARSGITVTVPRSMEVAEWHRVAPPADAVLLTIWQSHTGDPDNEFVVVWQGRVMAVEFSGVTAEIACENVYSSIRRAGLRRCWQRPCPHVLYGPECGVSRETFQQAGTATVVSGLTLTVPAFAALGSQLAGGYLQLALPDGQFERRAISAHAGSSVTIAQQIVGLAAGASIIAYPGCDHTDTATGCQRFSNTLRYGGMPFIPRKNPFDGSPVY